MRKTTSTQFQAFAAVCVKQVVSGLAGTELNGITWVQMKPAVHNDRQFLIAYPD
jgi:hypothetical protein